MDGAQIELKRVVGRGASGVVWEADSMVRNSESPHFNVGFLRSDAHTYLCFYQVSDLPVAVKLLKTEVPGLLENIDFETVNELEMEAKLLRSLRHRNIVMYHGTGELRSTRKGAK